MRNLFLWLTEDFPFSFDGFPKSSKAAECWKIWNKLSQKRKANNMETQSQCSTSLIKWNPLYPKLLGPVSLETQIWMKPPRSFSFSHFPGRGANASCKTLWRPLQREKKLRKGGVHAYASCKNCPSLDPCIELQRAPPPAKLFPFIAATFFDEPGKLAF